MKICPLHSLPPSSHSFPQANTLLKDQLDKSLRSLSLPRRSSRRGLSRAATFEDSQSSYLQDSVELQRPRAVAAAGRSPPVQYSPPKKAPQ